MKNYDYFHGFEGLLTWEFLLNQWMESMYESMKSNGCAWNQMKEEDESEAQSKNFLVSRWMCWERK